MSDFVSGNYKVRQRAMWERAVAERPVEAWLYGAPSWLVCEEADSEKDFEGAFQRVRARYFPNGDPRLHRGGGSVTSSVTGPISVTKPVTSATTCDTCGKEWSGYERECAACRKRRSRG